MRICGPACMRGIFEEAARVSRFRTYVMEEKHGSRPLRKGGWMNYLSILWAHLDYRFAMDMICDLVMPCSVAKKFFC